MTATLTRPRPVLDPDKYDGDGELKVIDYEPLPRVLESLTDNEKCLYAILLDRSGLDLAEMSWVDDSNPNGTSCFRAYPYQWSWWRDDSPKAIDQGARCLQVGQLVLTSEGWVPIEEVQIGDLVLTHRNRWRKVTDVFDRGVKEAVAVGGYGVHKPLVMTPDHRLWARHAVRASKPRDGHKGKKLLPAEWVHAEDLRVNDGSGQMATNWASPATIAALPLPAAPTHTGQGSGRANLVSDLWTYEWMWLYGLYIAEGSTYFDKQYSRAAWSVHNDEVAKVTAMLDHVGLTWSLDTNSDGACTTVRVSSRPMATWLKQHAGHRAENKQIAPWVYGLPEDLRQAVFDGMVFGDGHQRGNRSGYSTVSHKLLLGFRLLAQSLGQSCTSWVARTGGERNLGAREITCREAYAAEAQPMSTQTGRHRRVIFEDGHAWSPTAAPRPVSEVPMWDLEVEEDHSFVIEGVAVHNSVGKSESIIAEALVFVFHYPKQEFVIVTPEGTHADALTDRMEARIQGSRLMREMLTGGRSGINHRPFKAVFQNGARIMSRLPQRSGIGVKGIHPIVLHVDEAQDVSKETYAELPEVVRWEIPGARWRCHGVSRGVQDDDFYKMTQPDSGWTIHHIGKLHTPHLKPYTFRDPETGEHFVQHGYRSKGTKEEITRVPGLRSTNVRAEALDIAKENGWEVVANWLETTAAQYGGRQSQDFKRNVLGLHGASMNRIFMLEDLMAITDDRPGSAYNDHEYRVTEIRGDAVAARASSRTGRTHDSEVADDDQAAVIVEMVKIPGDHLVNYKTFWMGLDFGIINDPTEIVVLAEYELTEAERRRDENALIATPQKGRTRFKLINRIRLEQVAPNLQAHVVMHLINGYKPRAFSMDKTGNGVALHREVQRLAGVGSVYVMPGSDDDEGLVPAEVAQAAANAITIIKGYGFRQKVVIGIDYEKAKALGITSTEDILRQAAITANVKDAATDFLRDLVDQRRLMLPYDADVRNQLNSQVWSSSGEPVDAYGRRARIYSNAVDHILDAFRMFVLGMALQPLEDLEASTRQPAKPVFPIFG